MGYALAWGSPGGKLEGLVYEEHRCSAGEVHSSPSLTGFRSPRTGRYIALAPRPLQASSPICGRLRISLPLSLASCLALAPPCQLQSLGC